jgi:hypothetical protein
MIDVTVKVPEDGLVEFLQLHLDWLKNRTQGLSTPNSDASDRAAQVGLQHWSQDDGGLAGEIWRKLTEPAKRFVSILVDNPGRPFSGDEIAERLGLSNGKHGVAGLLGTPVSHCKAANRERLWSSDSPDGELKRYWITPENAALFRAARDDEG